MFSVPLIINVMIACAYLSGGTVRHPPPVHAVSIPSSPSGAVSTDNVVFLSLPLRPLFLAEEGEGAEFSSSLIYNKAMI